jgi:multidrug resistance efflux pump
MKKSVLIRLIVLTLLLSACNGLGGSNPTPLPTIVLDQGSVTSQPQVQPVIPSGGTTAASATIVSAQQAELAFGSPGKVGSIPVTLGQSVKAGDVLATLDDTSLKAAVAQAEANLAAAQAAYDQAVATLPAQHAANIASANLALQQAQNALSDLQDTAPLAAAEAQSNAAAAQKALNEAQRVRTNLDYPRASQTTIEGAQAAYDLKEEDLKNANQAYNNVRDLPADDPERARALLNLTNAQKARDQALATLNWYKGKNSDLDIAEADANLALAKAQLEDAQRKYAELKDGPAAKDLALANEKVTQAQALLDAANAQSVDAQLALLKAQLAAAQASLDLANASLADGTLVAPYDGVVAALNVQANEFVNAGQPVLVLADMSQLRVETTDLSEKDVSNVSIGQAATIFVKALNSNTSGHVIAISPLADTLGGDVVYKTVIALDEIPTGLLLGMSAEVRFENNP